MDLKEETPMDSEEEAFMDLKEETSMNSEEEASIDSEEETSTDSEKTSIDPEEVTIVICPRVEAEVELREGRLHLIQKIHGDPKETKCEADINSLWHTTLLLKVDGTTYVYCNECYGNGHKECYKSSPIKHPLHPKHTLLFVRWTNHSWVHTRRCICCGDRLERMFYCCPSCDFYINLACVDKKPFFTIDHPKRHEHTLTLFPRQTTLNCNVCALDHSRSSIYICPACDFVVHKSCMDLPWSIRISRHPHHRLSFTSSFVVEGPICNICRRKINNDYGGYICNKEGCSYFAHSRCATGKNVWDGVELEGVPEVVEKEEEPFKRLRDGTIRHCTHKHPLKLIEETTYDEYRSCQACAMPIYYGKFYSCTVDCNFILHEACENISRQIYHAIHPHRLLLEMESPVYGLKCSACFGLCGGFSYECEKCLFRLHVQCAMIHEPLIHKSHVHPLFLTSAPEERKICSVCKVSGVHLGTNETFNCIEYECDFSLCYKCAVLPQKVRYKHDEHILVLSYGEEMQNWCELCEKKIKPGDRFYTCDNYCCVTLHIQCLLGEDMNLIIGSKFLGTQILPNNSMNRPVCGCCLERCTQKVVFKSRGKLYCCYGCSRQAEENVKYFRSSVSLF